MLADFDTEAEALIVVRDLLAINSSDMADELILVWRDGDRGGMAAKGTVLATRAREIGPSRAPSSL